MLTKDVYIFDQMYDMNLEFYRDLTMYIIAGKKALAIARSTRLAELKEKAEKMAPQIRLLQDANQQMVDKLRADVLNTIPLWCNQMVLALGIEHTTKALKAQSAASWMWRLCGE